MSPRRRTVAAVLVAIGAIIYGISPIDVIPELFTGPVGFADDIAVWIGAGIGIWKLLSGRGKADGSTPPAAP
jgi:uncharacterized membrane protein YkvA (DUF1232 family)